MKRWPGYEHGVNLGGWFSQCDYSEERFDNFIKEEDVKTIASWGADHVRLPIDYNLVQNEAGDYLEKGFERIQQVIDWCKKYNLNMILDLHKTAGFSFDAGENQHGFFEDEVLQERFYRLWEQLALKFAKYESFVAFELLNEVTDQSYKDAWNTIALKCITRIRLISQTVKILVGGYWNNSCSSVKDLLYPCDENIIYNFHCYSPFIFTHQGAYWVKGMELNFRMSKDVTFDEYNAAANQLDMNYAGFEVDGNGSDKVISPQLFIKEWAEAVKTAEERNVALYCGEYGVIDRIPAEDTLEWYKAIHEAFEKCGIGRSLWNYREMDFGISDSRMDKVRAEVIKYL